MNIYLILICVSVFFISAAIAVIARSYLSFKKSSQINKLTIKEKEEFYKSSQASPAVIQKIQPINVVKIPQAPTAVSVIVAVPSITPQSSIFQVLPVPSNEIRLSSFTEKLIEVR